jgi:hypothetical protein
MLTEQKKNDSAIFVFLSLPDRYPIEASLPARGVMRAAELLAADSRSDNAREQLQRVISAHGRDALAGAAAVRIGESYIGGRSWTQAASALIEAKQRYSLTTESESRRLLALARADVGLGKKAEAIRQLRTLAELRGAPADIQSTGNALLIELQPPVKQKAKRGRHK